MVNRNGVGPAFARARGLVLLALVILGAVLLFRYDVSAPHSTLLRPSSSARLQASLARLPMSFEPNQGQTDTRVKFMARGNGYGLYLMPSEAVLTLPQASPAGSQSSVEMQLAGASQQSEIVGTEQLAGHSNYFIGNDSSRWLRNIPQFGRVQYRRVYPGINLSFYGNQNRLEYDFEVSPGSDAQQIELNFKGATNVSVASNGDLVLGLEGRELRFEAPHVYQKSFAGVQAVAGSFVLRGKNRAGFEVGPYDRSRMLVIDPVLAFSSYLGGTGDESCTAIIGATAGFVPHCPAIAVDSGGRIYVAGATTSTGTFSGVTPNITNTTGGTQNVFISRISLGSTGGVTTSSLDYVTYIGGSTGATPLLQYPTGIGVDSGFNVYVAGTTNASNYPTTPSAFQTSALSSGNHVFVSRIDQAGSFNGYSTYLSGTGVDTASNMALDSQGRVYVIGTTTSSNFPTTIGALQAAPNATNQFFFSKINPALNTTSSLQYSTYIGGSTPANGVVVGGAVAVDTSFNVYLAGGTNFTDMGTPPNPWIVNPYQAGAQGNLDVWAAKLNAPSANIQQYTLSYGTYFGGSSDDVAYGVASDGTDTYITGSTTSTNITVPTTTSSFQKTNGGGGDAFVAKFGVPAVSGTTQGTVPLDYFSYLGGTAQDVGLGIAADTLGNAYVTGLTAGGFPITPDAFQLNYGGGADDAFVARLNTTGTTTTTSTSTVSYLGGLGKDVGTSIALDSSLNTYVAGETAGTFPTKFPLSGGGTLLGATDAFVAQLGPNTSQLTMPQLTSVDELPACKAANPTVSPSPVGVGSPVTFTYYIYNQGDPVSNVVFTDTLGFNSGSTSASTSQGTCGSAVTTGALTCILGTVNSSTTTTTPTSCPTSTKSVNFAAKVTVTVNAPATVLQGQGSVGNTAVLSFPGGITPSVGGTATVNDYSVTARLASTNNSIPSGGQVNYSVTVTPTGSGFPESVAISCGSGLPAGAACSFPSPNGSTISSMSNGPQSRTLAITTTARVTSTANLFRRGAAYAVWLPILGVGLMGAGVSRKRRMLLGTFFALLLGLALLQAGCSSKSTTTTTTGTPAGTYTVTLNATSGSAARTTTVQFTVQ